MESLSTPMLIATMLLCAFVIDRIIASVMFVSSWIKAANDATRKGEVKRKELRKTLLYFFLSASLSAVALWLLGGLRLNLSAFTDNKVVAWVITWLILVAGADRISAFVGVASEPPPAAAESETVELRVTGTLRVDEETAKKLEQAQGS